GGDGDPAELLSTLEVEFPRLPGALLRRMSRAYGTRTNRILAGAVTLDDLGPVLAGDLTAREVDYLVNVEWAWSAEDILFRRTKLGLHIDRSATGPLEDYLERIRHAA
ncbi:MAG TPA: glycerol-3-phosphate dehydrogenase C-terminal domain-containing protein, partial [Sphingomicrobium sp.]